MSPVALTIALAGGLALLAVVLNHCYARLALVELALNEGLPPGLRPAAVRGTNAVLDPRSALEPGVHVFLSRSCHACQRLIDELDTTDLRLDATLYLRYVDRPRPIAGEAARRLGATLRELEADLPATLGADPLPFTIGVGNHGLVAKAVTPTVGQIAAVARDAGIRCDL